MTVWQLSMCRSQKFCVPLNNHISTHSRHPIKSPYYKYMMDYGNISLLTHWPIDLFSAPAELVRALVFVDTINGQTVESIKTKLEKTGIRITERTLNMFIEEIFGGDPVSWFWKLTGSEKIKLIESIENRIKNNHLCFSMFCHFHVGMAFVSFHLTKGHALIFKFQISTHHVTIVWRREKKEYTISRRHASHRLILIRFLQ